MVVFVNVAFGRSKALFENEKMSLTLVSMKRVLDNALAYDKYI